MSWGRMNPSSAMSWNTGLGDGSVRFLSKNIDLNRVLLPMASRGGGETVTLD